MYINSNLLEARLESRTKADIDNSLAIYPHQARLLYDANGDVIRVGDGSKFKNASDLEIRTSAQLATDTKYLGATRYDSTVNTMVVWNGSEWVPAKAGDLQSRTAAQLAVETPVAGRIYRNSTTGEIVFGTGASWLAFRDKYCLKTDTGVNTTIVPSHFDQDIIITSASIITIDSTTVWDGRIRIKAMADGCIVRKNGGSISGKVFPQGITLNKYDSVEVTLNISDTSEMLAW